MITAVYLSAGAWVLYDRWNEVGPLFEPPGVDSRRLPLNSIGDVLAGFFAPLAFLWLFVATLLQRKELRLQREELADTRAVLDQQKSELEKAANESNLQTKIMQLNLDSTKTKENYDTFNMSLYYIARRIYSFGTVSISYSEYDTHAGVYSWIPRKKAVLDFSIKSLSASDSSSVDTFFEDYYNLLMDASFIRFDKFKYKLEIDDDNDRAYDLFSTTIAGIDRLIENSLFLNNDLIIMRIDGIELHEIKSRCEIILNYIDDFNKTIDSATDF